MLKLRGASIVDTTDPDALRRLLIEHEKRMNKLLDEIESLERDLRSTRSKVRRIIQ